VSAWLNLLFAIAVEVTGTLGLKSTEGFSRLVPTLGVLVAYGISFLFLARAVQGLEVGVVYAVWSAVGTSLVAAFGILVLGESVSLLKIGSLAVIIVGVVGLNLAGASHG
jgi:small multidrug resistance pump